MIDSIIDFILGDFQYETIGHVAKNTIIGVSALFLGGVALLLLYLLLESFAILLRPKRFWERSLIRRIKDRLIGDH